ncbi:restriction endonuclease subunit S [Streptomyces gamaensis]|uniref:Restriction endonuclease subunit S n=1 Tax=Streptomyces gamaensis TaxID=1763542 RepID=A0ABW0YZN9_9ACTN
MGQTRSGLMLSDKTLRLVPDERRASARFLALVLSSSHVRSQVDSLLSGSTGQGNISQESVEELRIPDIPVVDQRSLVEVLDELAEAESALEASIAKLRTVRSSVVASVIPRGHELGMLAESTGCATSVRWVPVNEVGSVRMGKQLSPGSRASSEQYPYLRVANVLEERIDYSGVKTMAFSDGERLAYRLEPGDILLNEGQSLELVGRSAIYERGPGEFYFQNTLVRFRAGDGMLSRYAQAVFNCWLNAGVFVQIAKKTTSIAHLGAERFGSLLFPLVPLAEQRRIVDLVDAWDTRIRSSEDELSKLRGLKRGVMDDLLSGRVRVGSAE